VDILSNFATSIHWSKHPQEQVVRSVLSPGDPDSISGAMVSHFIIDKWYLTISFLITLAWQLTGFAIAWTFKVSCTLLNPPEAGLLLTMNSLTR
jgi:hypothetical protein